MRSVLLDPIADPAWLRLVERCPDASAFHHPLWLALLRDHYRYPVAAACAVDAGGEPVAGIPVVAVGSRLTGRRLVSVPFADACWPIAAPDAPAGALEAVATALEAERARRGIALQVRWRFTEAGTPIDLFHRHVIDLTDGFDGARGRFRKSVRKNLRTAERSGIEVERRTDRGALDAFYALHVATRHRLGVPTQPLAFIRGLDRFLDAGLGFVNVARHEGRPVAAGVFLAVGDTLLIKYSASDRAALPMRPNNAVVLAALQWAAEQGMGGLDFGRTDLGQDELRRYKLSWGSREELVAYTYAGAEPEAPGHGRADELLGQVIRRGPQATSRAVGELLYRHVG